jgi:flagellin
MAMTIATNLASLNAQHNLTNSQASLATSLQRLSSGLRINSAKDDAAGLAISERMTSQIRGLDQAARNANDAISLTQTAEGNMSQISTVLQRMREIAVQSANDTNTTSDRSSLQNEVTDLAAEIDRIAGSAQFNGKNLLDGTFGAATFQVGSNAGQTIAVTISSAKTSALGIGGAATHIGTAVAHTVASGMTINTTAIAAQTNDGVSYVAGAQTGTTSGKALATAINAQTGTTSVTATAVTTRLSNAVTATAALVAGSLYINGTDIGAVTVASNVADRTTQLVGAINAKSGTTGVTAAITTDDTYTLTAADGRNIDVTSTIATGGTNASGSGFTVNGATAGGVGGTAVTTYGIVTLTAGKAITVGGTAIAGLTATTYALVGGSVDVSSQINSNAAITSIDTAISAVNTARASMGTVQTRFDAVIANLHTSSDNISAARGRIRDTDFARETANMTRNQVLQQAGVAMLAQANALPNLVLSLLK